MAEEAQYNHHQIKSDDSAATTNTAVDSTDRGLFDFLGKKEEKNKSEGEAIAPEFDEKLKVSEKKEEHKDEETKKHEKLHRSSSSSSSSSEEEVEEDGEKKMKKKEKKKDKTKDEEKPAEGEEKKGFLDKIKEKIPGGKKAEEVASPPPTPATTAECEAEGKEKKGLLDKIKEKIPGYHPKTDEEKEKEKEGAHH